MINHCRLIIKTYVTLFEQAITPDSDFSQKSSEVKSKEMSIEYGSVRTPPLEQVSLDEE